jgi:hypothetical protein
VSVRPLLAIGIATAGISVAFAAPAAATPSTASHQHVVRNSTKATPNGGSSSGAASSTGSSAKSRKLSAQASSTASSSAQGSVPTSNKRVLSSDGGTSVGVKHHWGTHNRHHGIL